MVLLMINTKSQTNPLWSSRDTDHAPSRWEVKTGPCTTVVMYLLTYNSTTVQLGPWNSHIQKVALGIPKIPGNSNK